jgi:hypothetical protein
MHACTCSQCRHPVRMLMTIPVSFSFFYQRRSGAAAGHHGETAQEEPSHTLCQSGKYHRSCTTVLSTPRTTQGLITRVAARDSCHGALLSITWQAHFFSQFSPHILHVHMRCPHASCAQGGSKGSKEEIKARMLAIKEGRDPAAAVAALTGDSVKEKKVSTQSCSCRLVGMHAMCRLNARPCIQWPGVVWHTCTHNANPLCA